MRPGDPRIRAQLEPARRPLAVVVAGSAVGAACVVAQAFAVAGFVVAALNGEHVLRWGLLLGAVLSGRALAGLVVDVAAARAAAEVGAHLRRQVMEAALHPGRPRATGEMAVLVTRGVQAAEPYLTRYLPALVLAGILPWLVVVVIASQDLLSAVIVLATLPLVPVFGALVGLATRDRAEAQWRALASLSGHFVDVMKGLPTLVVFRRARAQTATIRQITDRYRISTLQTLRVAFASSAVLELVATLSVALVAVVVGVRLAEGQLGLRTALVVLLLAPEAYAPLRRAGAEFHAAAEGVATFEQVASLTSTPEPELAPGQGPIVVRDLTVTWPGRTVPALDHLCATLPERGLTAVVGPSGSGKSTLLTALAGLVPSTGSVAVGGREVGGDAWRSQIAWVPQRPAFLSGSVADNLRLARPDATDDELWSGLGQVGLAVRVRQLPHGMGTRLGEDAASLSAGERARLALARAIVARRPWLFLDEPTAHVDATSEGLIANALVGLSRTSGVVVVAHCPGLVQIADHIVRIDPPTPQPQPHRESRVLSCTPSATEPSADGPSHRRGFAVATTLGALASASGVALTATAGWLIVKASEQPPVLTMLVAIVGVRAFGLARPVLRYAERLLGHDAALRLLAERRTRVTTQSCP